jgi:hypothetical protein
MRVGRNRTEADTAVDCATAPSPQLTRLRIRIYPQKITSLIRGIPNLFAPARSLTKSLDQVLIHPVFLFVLSQIIGVYVQQAIMLLPQEEQVFFVKIELLMRTSEAALPSQRNAQHPSNPIEGRLRDFLLIVWVRFVQKHRGNGLGSEIAKSNRNIAGLGAD